jgi:hypothetical protein
MLTLLLATILAVTIKIQPIKADPTTSVYIGLPSKTVALGDSFTVNVTVENVENLFAWQVALYYPSSVLNGTQVDEGPFLKVGGSTNFMIVNFTDTYNATYGYLLVGDVLLGALTVNGSGTLATVTFKAIGAGPCALNIDTTDKLFPTQLLDLNPDNIPPNNIPFTTVDREVTIVAEFPSLAILPLFMIATIVSLVAFRKWKMTGAKPKQ